MENKTIILDKQAQNRAISRIAYEIIERNKGADGVLIIGIKSRGEILASRIAQKIMQLEGNKVESLGIDITPYRDDVEVQTKPPKPDFDISGRRVVLVDDVLYTGRTVRAALDAVFAMGRPSVIELAVLVDRGHRELPIRPDYIGKNLPTARSEKVRVLVEEIDREEGVVLYK